MQFKYPPKIYNQKNLKLDYSLGSVVVAVPVTVEVELLTL